MVRSRAALSRALLELLEHKAFDQITIREITARAGIGYATFFRHYPGKETLLDELGSEQIRQLLSLSVPALYETDSRRSCLALCDYVAEHRQLWTALLTGGAAGITREAFLRAAKQLPVDEKALEGWLPADLRVIYGTTATVEVLAWWLQKHAEFAPEQVAEILDRLVVSPTMAIP
jgi:AcrR family transcriptional regulator